MNDAPVHDDASQRGYDAIRDHLSQHYPDQPDPSHYGVIISRRLGGNDPLYGVSLYRVQEPVPHWHAVSYGMSDVYDEQINADGESGYGMEFTMRVADPAAADPSTQGPIWIVALMQTLARYVFGTGNRIQVNEHMDYSNPVGPEPTELRGLLFVEDETLGSIDTPNGTVKFVQIMAVNEADLHEARRWRVNRVVDLYRRRSPLGVVGPEAQRPLSEVPEYADEIAAGVERDGSALGMMYALNLTFDTRGPQTVVTTSTKDWASMVEALGTRLAHGKPFRLESNHGGLAMVPADDGTNGVEVAPDEWPRVTISLNPETVERLRLSWRAEPGTVNLGQVRIDIVEEQ